MEIPGLQGESRLCEYEREYICYRLFYIVGKVHQIDRMFRCSRPVMDAAPWNLYDIPRGQAIAMQMVGHNYGDSASRIKPSIMVNGGEIWHMLPIELAASVFAPNNQQAINDEKERIGRWSLRSCRHDALPRMLGKKAATGIQRRGKKLP